MTLRCSISDEFCVTIFVNSSEDDLLERFLHCSFGAVAGCVDDLQEQFLVKRFQNQAIWQKSGTNISIERMIAFDLIIDSVGKGLDSFIITNLHKLDADLAFLNCRPETIKKMRCFHDDELNIFKSAFWRPICKNEQVEARESHMLANIHLLESIDIVI